MKCLILLIFILLAPGSYIISQNENTPTSLNVISPGRYHFSITNEGGVNPSKSKIEGTQFIHENWLNGKVTLNNGKIIKEMKLRFDAYQNKMVFKYNGLTYSLEKEKIVKKIILLSPNNKGKQIFLNISYKKNQNTNKGFMELLVDGNYKLFKKHSCKFIKSNYNPVFNSGNKNHRLVHQKQLYIMKKSSKAIPLPKKRKAFLNFFENNKSGIQKYLNNVSLNPKEEKDLITIIRYANFLRE